MIAPSLGAVSYTIGENQINVVPGGENASFQQVLLRAPGVVQDSFGQEHVRGEHANLTYRVNGVLLPEPLNGFGQELDTRLINNVTLIDGSLPAQFGLHTAGIVDVTTKTGTQLDSDEVAIYGGSYNTFQPSIQLGGHHGKLDYFFTGSYLTNNFGIENPVNSNRPSHDTTEQYRGFGYAAYTIDETSRLSLLVNSDYSDFQIPNTPGLAPTFNVAAAPHPQSANLDENQNEQEYYGRRRVPEDVRQIFAAALRIHAVRAAELHARRSRRPRLPGPCRRGPRELCHQRGAVRFGLHAQRPAHHSAAGSLPTTRSSGKSPARRSF